MRPHALAAIVTALAAALAAAAGCESNPGLAGGSTGAFTVTIRAGERGSEAAPLPYANKTERTYTLDVAARRVDAPARVDESFDGYVAIRVVPAGQITAIDGKLTTVEPAIRLVRGRATGVKVTVRRAYGAVRFVVSDEGYAPVPPGRKDAAGKPLPPGCNNGRDDDGDGFIDAAVLRGTAGPESDVRLLGDRGCFAADDDTEEAGSGATGASPTIHVANPRIADMQEPGFGDGSSLVDQRVTFDRGFMVVTRVSVGGFFVTDYDGARWDGKRLAFKPEDLAFDHIFVFNFSTPRNLRRGDCLVQLDGTVKEFFGYTELDKPTWKRGDYAFCAGLARAAGVPEATCPREATDRNRAQQDACRRLIEDMANTPVDVSKLKIGGAWVLTRADLLERYEAGLVSVSNVTMSKDVKTCDTDGDGRLDDPANCGNEPDCYCKETFDRYGQWTANWKNPDGGPPVEVSVVTTGAVPGFDPLAASAAARASGKPKTFSRIVGTLRHVVVARPQWILEPRGPLDCPDCTN